MSHLVRFTDGTGDIRVGLLADEQLRPLAVASMSDLLRHTVAEIRELAEAAGGPCPRTGRACCHHSTGAWRCGPPG